MNPCIKHEAQETRESGSGFKCYLCEIERQQRRIDELENAIAYLRSRHLLHAEYCKALGLGTEGAKHYHHRSRAVTDLVERLREMRPDFIQESGAIMLEAANEIERLRAENESLLAVYESANSVLSVLTMDHRLERNLEAACEQYEALSAQEHE